MTSYMTEREAARIDAAIEAKEQRERLLREMGEAAGFSIWQHSRLGFWHVTPPATAGWRAADYVGNLDGALDYLETALAQRAQVSA